jgi:3-dehydrotetronate 4-kinase
MALLLGCIADDLTGATDLAVMLSDQGMPTVLRIGPVGTDSAPPPDVPADVPAVVVALKSRTAPVEQAVEQSLAAARWLLHAGADQLFFKYCSTFDSTDAGNIGPVAEALLDACGEAMTVVCPAFPANRRTIYRGHLFVGDVLLSESSMRDHPLTPMRDANLLRVLGRQCRADSRIGLVPLETVMRGPDAVRDALTVLRNQSHRFAVLDAVTDEHLVALGQACADLRLLTGGSGLAMGLPENFRQRGRLAAIRDLEPVRRPADKPAAVVLAGSCSAATRGQVEHAAGQWPLHRLDPLALAAGTQTPANVVAWAGSHMHNSPIVIASTAEPRDVEAAQQQLGRERAATLIEHAMADIARRLADAGAGTFIVAGGETSGAVVEALGVTTLRIGQRIDPGVPWTQAARDHDGQATLALALKSGNFGSRDFFTKALDMLQWKIRE